MSAAPRGTAAPPAHPRGATAPLVAERMVGPHGDIGHEAPSSQPSTAVLVDIGGDVGALVLRSSASREGLEVEIEQVGVPGTRTHVYVLARRAGDNIVHAAVFPSLPEGAYTVFDLDGAASCEVVVRGGVVTEADWGG